MADWGKSDPVAAPWGRDDPVAKPPARRGQSRNALDEANGLLANIYRGTVVLDEANAGIMALGNALFGGGVPIERKAGESPYSPLPLVRSVAGTYQNALARQRGAEDDFAARRPVAAAVARNVGTTASMFVPGGAPSQIVASGGRLAGAARGATVAAAQGYAYGLADRGTPGERLDTANKSAVVSAALGGVMGGAVARGKPKASKPVDPNVATLNREGVILMPGQIRGGMAKAAEDVATSAPILGGAIQNARSLGMGTFAAAPVKRALRQIDETLPEGLTGFDAIAHGQKRFSAGYEAAIPEGGVIIDSALGDSIVSSTAPIVRTLTAGNAKRLKDILDQRLAGRVGESGAMDGATYKRVIAELGKEERRFSRSEDPDHQAMAEAISSVSDALAAAAMKQNPAYGATMAKLDRGYAEFLRAERAAGMAGAEDGVFTAAQYDRAVKAGDYAVRNRNYSAGEAFGQDLSRAGRAVMPNKLPDSGTGKRGLLNYGLAAAAGSGAGGLGAALSGGAAATGAIGVLAPFIATVGGLAAASRMYSPKAIAAANKALTARVSAQDQAAALAELRAIAESNPKARELYQTVFNHLTRASAIVGSSATRSEPNALSVSR